MDRTLVAPHQLLEGEHLAAERAPHQLRIPSFHAPLLEKALHSRGHASPPRGCTRARGRRFVVQRPHWTPPYRIHTGPIQETVMNLPQFSLEGKVALVTGGSRGIGEATAYTLARAGAAVAVSSRKLPDLERV